jgi:STE24 endopeptidase
MVNTLYFLILSIIIIDFAFERWLDYLNTTRWSATLPPEFKGIYDEDKYTKSQEYEKAKHRFSLLISSLGFACIILLFSLGGFGWLDLVIREKISNPILIALIFFGILGLASDILSLPFSWYEIFHIETKFGFNTSTPKLFIFDHLKSMMVAIILGGAILSLIVWIYQIAGNLFWVYALIVITSFSFFMTLFYSNLIVPLFNKQTLLADGTLKTAIQDLCTNVGFNLDKVFIIDGSKRSTKANAYFTGLGKKKRIVLYDTLINDMETEEIVAVLAHEIGHYKKRHIIYTLILSFLSTALMLYIFSLVSVNVAFAKVLGAKETGFHLAIVTFGILYSPLSFIIGIGMNIFSRRNEFEADNFAAKYYDGSSLASALKRLSVKNLSNLTPHPVYVFFHYSHPSLLERLKNLDNHSQDVFPGK